MQNPNPWRNWLLALIVANVLFWAWAQGALRWLGVGPTPVQEPQRLQQQVQPQGLQLRAPATTP